MVNERDARFTCEISGRQFRVVDFMAYETISSPYEVNLSLASEDEVNFDDVMAQDGTFRIIGDDGDHYFNGEINEFAHIGMRGRFHLYQARMVPHLSRLLLKQNCRIFKRMKVRSIVHQILVENGIPTDRWSFRFQNQYPDREFCVQYRETDFNFVSRLLEEEGIFYCFEHFEDKDVLVFGDSTVAYQSIQGGTQQEAANVRFHVSDQMVPQEEMIYQFAYSQKVLSEKVVQRDFNFERSTLDLTCNKEAYPHAAREIYDYPGKYQTIERGNKLTQVRLEESMTLKDKAEGESVCPRFMPGFMFNLTNHDRESFNRTYLLIEVIHTGSQHQVFEEEAEEESGLSYSNNFAAIPSSVTYRPERKTPKTIVEGLHTAIVTGPSGEEIHTDRFGQVKVQFHWDREGNRDDRSSCWLRVGQLWAGKGWGTVFIPRVGDEVLVDFLEGDPDKPIIVGSVYNDEAPPLYPLPSDKTKTTIKTKSYPNDPGFNEIRFEDKKGQEEVFIHAERSLVIQAKGGITKSGASETISIGGDRKTTIKANDTVTVEGNRETTIYNNETLNVNQETTFNAIGLIKVTGLDKITLEGAGEIHIKSATKVLIEAPDVQIIGSGYVKIESGGANDVKGNPVKLNC